MSAGAGDYRPRLWDVVQGVSTATLAAHEAAIHALLWIDPYTILSGCEAGVVAAHDLRSGNVIWKQRLLQSKGKTAVIQSLYPTC
jgi:WD40 repeat protein